jgi:hypothetical protein
LTASSEVSSLMPGALLVSTRGALKKEKEYKSKLRDNKYES